MCKAFSCVVGRSGKVFWKAGIDSHNDIFSHFKLKDDAVGRFQMVEVTLDNGYLHPEGKWTLRFDNNSEKPFDWWKASHEKHCMDALRLWKKEVYSKINLKDARNPIHPFKLPPVKNVTGRHIKLLVEWGSGWGSVRDSAWGSVRDSVRDSVWTYAGGLFPNIKVWKCAETLGPDPWRPLLILWYAGYVPSFDGKTWRLHAGKGAKVVLTWTPKGKAVKG